MPHQPKLCQIIKHRRSPTYIKKENYLTIYASLILMRPIHIHHKKFEKLQLNFKYDELEADNYVDKSYYNFDFAYTSPPE